MENEGKNWSDEDIDILKKYYEINGSKYCVSLLKRNQKAIVKKARKIGLKAPKNGFRYKKENLEPLVKASKTIKEVLEKMGLRAAGGNYKIINDYIKKYNIDINHFKDYKIELNRILVERVIMTQKPIDEILVENSNYSRTSLKERLYKEGLKKNECELCGQGELWKGKKMSLILDHINGVYNDNRINNLRIVCPNCNATLPTHGGKNNKNKQKE